MLFHIIPAKQDSSQLALLATESFVGVTILQKSK
jgi:hypothetical protein